MIHWFVYPFTSAQPNFADVEAVYSKMVVPDTWVKVGEGANSGIAGRRCPIESDGCFSKSANFSIKSAVSSQEVIDVIEQSGCASPALKDETYKGDPEGSRFSYSCFAGAIRVGISVDMKMGEIHVVAASR
jgi:hypothetical protein